MIRLLFFAACLLLPTLAQAADPILDAAERHARNEAQGLPGEVTIRVGQLDPQTRLPACSSLQAYTPPGAKPWGRTHVGVRCLGPAQWAVLVPVQISVVRPYLVTARPLAAGQIIQPEDLATLRGDLANLPAGVLTEQQFVVGKTLKNALAAGLPLRGDQLLAPQLVKQGQSVKLVTRGPGFSITGEGKALTNGGAGQIVQVRVPSGQTISGIVQDDGSVEIRN